MHPKSKKYVPGDMWKECPRCGFDVLRSQMKEDGITKQMMCSKCADPADIRRG